MNCPDVAHHRAGLQVDRHRGQRRIQIERIARRGAVPFHEHHSVSQSPHHIEDVVALQCLERQVQRVGRIDHDLAIEVYLASRIDREDVVGRRAEIDEGVVLDGIGVIEHQAAAQPQIREVQRQQRPDLDRAAVGRRARRQATRVGAGGRGDGQHQVAVVAAQCQPFHRLQRHGRKADDRDHGR